jgi:hypothetical protein
MLPAPFYAEVPSELGDDQTWVDHEAAGRHGDEVTPRPGRWLRAVIDDTLASGAQTLFSRVRKLLAL